ncbi:hypothetical protein LSAT2_023336 [Lamellibrachia satsuma]|nr:hypothetical protein LSAT2_023336 [Lamellibrachia satsuma]
MILSFDASHVPGIGGREDETTPDPMRAAARGSRVYAQQLLARHDSVQIVLHKEIFRLLRKPQLHQAKYETSNPDLPERVYRMYEEVST